jgi:hypothetical protein
MVFKYQRATDSVPGVSSLFLRRGPREDGERGEILSKWSVTTSVTLNNIRSDRRYGDARESLGNIQVLRRLDRLGNPALLALLHFMESDLGRNNIGMLTSQ